MDDALLHQGDDDLLAEFGQVLREQAGEDGVCHDRIEGYRLEREIHRGGQGVVLEAYQESTKRPVAVKLLLDGALASAADRLRFEREVELVAQLRHPSIVTVHESGKTRDGRQFISMELIEGARFDAFIKERFHAEGLPTEAQCREIVRVFLPVCDAIEYAHRRGVIHRDIKPGNILITDDGRPVVLDFGIAKASGAEHGTTKTGDFLGTLSYAAPEQLGGSPDLIDTRADVYALGVVLYEALTGQRPSGGEELSIAEAVRNVTQNDARRGSSINPAVSRDLDAVLRKALERDPTQRYQTAGQLRDELNRAISGRPVRAREHERWYLARKYVIRHKTTIGVMAAIFSLALVAVAAGVQSTLKARQASRFAEVADSVVTPILGADYETAEPVAAVRDLVDLLDQMSVDIGRRLNGFPRHEAPLRSTIGLAYLGRRELEKAERELRAALRLWQSVRGAAPTTLALAHHNLGRVLWFQAKYVDAEREYREALRLRTEALGSEHLDTARTMHHLAATLQGRGAFAESERLWLETIRVRRKLLEPSDPDIPNTLVGYGSFLHEIGRHADAAEIYADALALITAISGEQDWRTARTMHGLAICLADAGEYVRARRFLERALEIKLGHNDEIDIIKTRLALARLDLFEQRDLESALETVSAQIERLESQFGFSHPNSGEALTLEADLLLVLGRASDAEASARLAIESHQSRWGDRNWRLGRALDVLAQSLIAQGRHAEAIAPLQRAVEILRSVRDAEDPIRRASEARAISLGVAISTTP
ncbi:MAG: tetratricopeptide repeat protein [Phycisphaerales bacterium JB059]